MKYELVFIILFWFILPIISAKLLLKYFIEISHEKKWVRKNYKGKKIPSSLGIIFAINSSIFYILFGIILLSNYWEFRFSAIQGLSIIIFSILILIIGISGFYDDLYGEKDIKGFKGHFKKLFKEKKVTSGLVKLITGGIASFVCGYLIESSIFICDKYSCGFDFSILKIFLIVFLNTLIISLFINLINLFDLRPGRSTKGFFIILFFMVFLLDIFNKNIVLSFLQWIYVYLLPVLFPLLVYSLIDFKEKGMMGDSGSNLLGFILGSGVVFAISLFNYPTGLYLRFILLFLLVFFHIWCEFYSLSNLIEKNKILKFIDRIGIDQ